MPEKTQVKKATTKVKATIKKDQPKMGGFAVIATGGKQYKVAVGDSVRIEKIMGEFKEGDSITFDNVLLKDDGVSATTLGTPDIAQAKVIATLSKIGRAQKVIVLKYKQKSRYYKKNGHRQPFFEVKIDSIN